MNNKEIYMTKQDVVNEFLNKINCDKKFEMLTDYEKNFLIQRKIKLFADELYDLNKMKITYLSERDTYIIRKLYGVLDSGKCIVGLRLQEELNISNIGNIKSNCFKRINKDLEKTLNEENFNKKRKMFFELFGVSPQFFKLNIFMFNKNICDKFLDIDNYIKNTPFQIILEETKEVIIYIKSTEDLKKINSLTEREIEIIKLRFDLKNNNQRFTTKELADKFEITQGRIIQIESHASRKIRNFYAIRETSKKFELSGLTPIDAIGLDVRTVNCLKRAGIETVEELLSKSKKEFLSIRNFGPYQFQEILEVIFAIKKIEQTLIKKLNLSPRTHRYLFKEGIFTVEELLSTTEEQLLNIVGVGGLKEIKFVLEQNNLGKLAENHNAAKLELIESVDKLDLAPSLKNSLKRAGIFTIEKLLTKTEEDLIKLRGIGYFGTKRIIECMNFIKESNNIHKEEASNEKQTLLLYKKVIELESKKSQLLEEEQQIDVKINETNEKLERLKKGDINEPRKK